MHAGSGILLHLMPCNSSGRHINDEFHICPAGDCEEQGDLF